MHPMHPHVKEAYVSTKETHVCEANIKVDTHISAKESLYAQKRPKCSMSDLKPDVSSWETSDFGSDF